VWDPRVRWVGAGGTHLIGGVGRTYMSGGVGAGGTHMSGGRGGGWDPHVRWVGGAHVSAWWWVALIGTHMSY
jgi:hypothetical protein